MFKVDLCALEIQNCCFLVFRNVEIWLSRNHDDVTQLVALRLRSGVEGCQPSALPKLNVTLCFVLLGKNVNRWCFHAESQLGRCEPCRPCLFQEGQTSDAMCVAARACQAASAATWLTERSQVRVEPLCWQCKEDWSPVKTSHPSIRSWIGNITTPEDQRALVKALKKKAHKVVQIDREQAASNEFVGGRIERSVWMANKREVKFLFLREPTPRMPPIPCIIVPPGGRPRLVRASVAFSRNVRVTSTPCACSRCTPT